MDSLQIETSRSRQEDRFAVQGELDLASSPKLEEALQAALTGPGRALVVDVSQVRFLDCTAVGMLLRVRRNAESQGCTLRLQGATGVVLQVLEIAGVAKRLGLYDLDHPSDDAEQSITAHKERTAAREERPASDELVISMLDTMSQLAPEHREHDQIREHVVSTCAPFATSLARRFRNRGEPFDDLHQVAMVGLLKAVDGYDPRRGREFIAYAKPTILGELRRHFRDRTWAMTVPRRHKEMRLALNAVREELAQQLGRSPTAAELAERLQVSTEDVLQAIEAAQVYQSVSLSTPVGEEEGATLSDLVGNPDPNLEAVENREALPALLATLPEREQRILAMRFYGNMTQSQIAEWTGVSQMHVSRLLKGALGQLRTQLLQDEQQ